MKVKFVLIFVLGLIVLSQFSCSNEVEVIGKWRDIPVVYGVLNNQDTAHYIRIERAYLPPNRSALEVAKIADSLYFDPNEVKIELKRITVNNDTAEWLYPIERVNLADEGIIRDNGTFQNNPSYAYKTKGTTPHDILLVIHHYKTGNTFYARTEAVAGGNSSLLTTPSYSLNPQKPIAWRAFDTQGNEVYSALTVEMLGNGFAAIYDYKFRFHYKEYEIDNQGVEVPGTRTSKSIEWRAASDFVPAVSNQTQLTVEGEAFYQFLGRSLSDVTGTNTRRCVGYLEVYIDGASKSLKNYILARKSNEGFVGGLYPSEPYSNVSGGYGVLATSDRLERKNRASDPRLMKMSNLTLKHIREGEHTKHLGFESPAPCY